MGIPAEIMRTRKGLSRFRNKIAWAGFLFMIPTFMFWCLWTALPVILSLYASLTEWNLVGSMSFIGLGNFLELPQDKIFIIALRNTLVFVFLGTPISILVSLTFALLINETANLRQFFISAFFIPVVTSMAVVAIIWKWLYQPSAGLFNYLLSLLGIAPLKWLLDTKLVIPSVIIMSIWKNLGFAMVIFIAGLQGIPLTLYESAFMDGCSKRKSLWYITLPLLRPVTLFVFITSIIGSFQLFTQIYIMTEGGPRRASTVLAYYLYESAFISLRMGYASAIAVVMLLFMLIITVVQLKFFQKDVTY